MKLSPDELVSKRKELIKPIFNEFHEWLLEIQPKVPPTLKFGRAITYALSSWEHLLNYLDSPDLFLDNSIAERSIKPFVIGRKNWLFPAVKPVQKVLVSYLLLLKMQNSTNLIHTNILGVYLISQ